MRQIVSVRNRPAPLVEDFLARRKADCREEVDVSASLAKTGRLRATGQCLEVPKDHDVVQRGVHLRRSCHIA